MATAILSNVGRATDGPLGQMIGSVVGGSIDRALTGTPGTAALGLQSSAYGEAIPRIYGTMRVSGGVLWSTGLTQNGTVLDKLVGGASGPSYSTNIAVGISARPIQGIGRIWADGKLMRDASGETSVAGAIRIYTGAEDQAADPLIVAVEGMAGAPAYRGIAYVVFDNLGLDDFANHVPQFGFDVFADPASVTLATVAIDLFAAAGAASPNASALTATLDGYGVGGGSTLGGALGQLAVLEPHSLVAEDRRLVLRTPLDAPAFVLNERVGGAFAGSKHAQTRVWRTEAAQRAPDLIEVRYFDPARDHQIGQQNASARRATRAIKTYDLPASMTAVAARALAARLGYDAEAARGTRSISLPYAYAAIEVGDTVAVDDDPRTWIVRRVIIDAMVVGLDLEAWAGAGAISASADAGRSLVNPFARQGPTTLDLLDLPAFDDDGSTLPRSC